jgi:hypothetical protein
VPSGRRFREAGGSITYLGLIIPVGFLTMVL